MLYHFVSIFLILVPWGESEFSSLNGLFAKESEHHGHPTVQFWYVLMMIILLQEIHNEHTKNPINYPKGRCKPPTSSSYVWYALVTMPHRGLVYRPDPWHALACIQAMLRDKPSVAVPSTDSNSTTARLRFQPCDASSLCLDPLLKELRQWFWNVLNDSRRLPGARLKSIKSATCLLLLRTAKIIWSSTWFGSRLTTP